MRVINLIWHIYKSWTCFDDFDDDGYLWGFSEICDNGTEEHEAVMKQGGSVVSSDGIRNIRNIRNITGECGGSDQGEAQHGHASEGD